MKNREEEHPEAIAEEGVDASLQGRMYAGVIDVVFLFCFFHSTHLSDYHYRLNQYSPFMCFPFLDSGMNSIFPAEARSIFLVHHGATVLP